MKNLIYLVALFLLAPVFQAVAQNDEGTRFGLKAGVNLANVYDEKGEEFVADGKLGWVAGAFLAIPIGDVIGFQPELLVSQKGFDGSGSLLGLNYTFTRTTTYLDIPLQLQIRPASAVTIVVGPQFSYLLRTKDDFGDGDITIIQEEEISNEDFRKSIFGVVGGVDFYLRNLVLSARASGDLISNNGDGNSTNPRYKNQLFQFTAGFAF